MKSIILLLILNLFITTIIFPADNDNAKTVIKRNIIILPFININEVEKFKYIPNSLRDAIYAKLLEINGFNLISFSDIDNNITQSGITKEDIIYGDFKFSLANKLKADIIIYGSFIVIENQIKLQMNVSDKHTKQTVISINIQGNVGLDIFRLIDDSAIEMTNKIKEKYPPIDSNYFKNQMKIQRLKLFTPSVKTGISLTSAGAGLFIIGLGIIIYDIAGYSDVVKNNLFNNPRSDLGYQDYLNANYTHIALFSAGLTSMLLGITFMIIGIPLMVYNIYKEKKTISLNIKKDKDLQFYCSIKF